MYVDVNELMYKFMVSKIEIKEAYNVIVNLDSLL